MQDKELLTITVVTDDIVGDLDFGIHGLGNYLRKGDTIEKRDKVLSMLGYLAHRVCEITDRVQEGAMACSDDCNHDCNKENKDG